MDENYLALVVFGAMCSGFIAMILTLSSLVGPKCKSATKSLPFECGSVSVGNITEQRFNVKFYIVAMLFILFDIEVIFMYPWAMSLRQLGFYGFFVMLSFVSVLGLGLIYVLGKGLLDWHKVKK